MSDPAIDIAGLAHRYQGADAPTLSIARLSILARERVALIGTSGAGKSTLLNLIDGRLRGWTGSANVLGLALQTDRSPPRDHRRRTGFVFQEFALVEQATAFRNVMNGRLGHMPVRRSLFGLYRPADAASVDRALHDVGLDDFAARRAERLSGGQRQRVAIARCLAQQPDLILADEPVASLDPVNARSVLTTLRDAAEQRGAALVISSHQPDLVADYVDRFVALDGGAVVYDGPAAGFDDSRFAAVYGGRPDDSSQVDPT